VALDPHQREFAHQGAAPEVPADRCRSKAGDIYVCTASLTAMEVPGIVPKAYYEVADQVFSPDTSRVGIGEEKIPCL
jgi:hypothetical protein